MSCFSKSTTVFPGFQQSRRCNEACGAGAHERHVHVGGLRGAAAGGLRRLGGSPSDYRRRS